MISIQLKKYLFILLLLLTNIILIYTNVYYFYYLYIVIFFHAPLSKMSLIFVIIYYKIKGFIVKKEKKIKDYLNDLICLTITCYCESFEEIFNTILSLEKSFKHSKKNNLLFIVFDGLCKENNTDSYTWEILLNKMTKINKIKKNIKYTKNWKNYEINIDLISCNYNDLNVILLIKHKNLGKKDSLNILRDYSVNKLDDKLSREIDLLLTYHNIKQNDIILVGSMDADCIVNIQGIIELYNDILQEDVMGVSGFVLPKKDIQKKFWYIYQLTEYYNTQYITRLAYSLLGKTTCLPGALNIFDMKYYNDNIRKEFQKLPNKNHLFKSLVALIGEDRRFTGLILKHNDKKCKTIVNENVHILTSLPNTTNKFKTQRRRWITSSLLNNIYDLKNKNVPFLVKYNTFATTLYAFLIYYVIFMGIYLFFELRNNFLTELNIFPYSYNITFYYRLIIYIFTITIIIFQFTFLKKMNNNKDRLRYLFGVIFFMLFIIFCITSLLTYCLYKLDNVKWGNIKQNNEENEKIEIKIIEDINMEEIKEVNLDL